MELVIFLEDKHTSADYEKKWSSGLFPLISTDSQINITTFVTLGTLIRWNSVMDKSCFHTAESIHVKLSNVILVQNHFK